MHHDPADEGKDHHAAWEEAPPGASTVRVRHGADIYDASVTDGYWFLALWDVDPGDIRPLT